MHIHITHVTLFVDNNNKQLNLFLCVCVFVGFGCSGQVCTYRDCQPPRQLHVVFPWPLFWPNHRDRRHWKCASYSVLSAMFLDRQRPDCVGGV